MGAEMSIKAMKQALEAIESAIKAGDWKVDGACDPDMAIHFLRQAIADAEKQEPVAWMREDEDCTDCIVWEQTEEHTIALYTHPPQRQWVGLTNEEQQHFRKLGFVGVEQVEAKLREKNGIKGKA
jgi:hypothetical protein